MNSCQAQWEDEENNRRVELVVNYRLEAARVEINHVTPTRVTFVCPKTGDQTRSIGIWTNGGRRVLARQVKAAGRLHSLKEEIAAGNFVEIKHLAPKYAAEVAPVLTA